MAPQPPRPTVIPDDPEVWTKANVWEDLSKNPSISTSALFYMVPMSTERYYELVTLITEYLRDKGRFQGNNTSKKRKAELLQIIHHLRTTIPEFSPQAIGKYVTHDGYFNSFLKSILARITDYEKVAKKRQSKPESQQDSVKRGLKEDSTEPSDAKSAHDRKRRKQSPATSSAGHTKLEPDVEVKHKQSIPTPGLQVFDSDAKLILKHSDNADNEDIGNFSIKLSTLLVDDSLPITAANISFEKLQKRWEKEKDEAGVDRPTDMARIRFHAALDQSRIREQEQLTLFLKSFDPGVNDCLIVKRMPTGPIQTFERELSIRQSPSISSTFDRTDDKKDVKKRPSQTPSKDPATDTSHPASTSAPAASPSSPPTPPPPSETNQNKDSAALPKTQSDSSPPAVNNARVPPLGLPTPSGVKSSHGPSGSGEAHSCEQEHGIRGNNVSRPGSGHPPARDASPPPATPPRLGGGPTSAVRRPASHTPDRGDTPKEPIELKSDTSDSSDSKGLRNRRRIGKISSTPRKRPHGEIDSNGGQDSDVDNNQDPSLDPTKLPKGLADPFIPKADSGDIIYDANENGEVFSHTDAMTFKRAAETFGVPLEAMKGRKPVKTNIRGLQRSLHPYQMIALLFMSEASLRFGGGCVADEVGYGKTTECIAYIIWQLQQLKNGPTLIVAPATLLSQWLKEFQACAVTAILERIYVAHDATKTNVVSNKDTFNFKRFNGSPNQLNDSTAIVITTPQSAEQRVFAKCKAGTRWSNVFIDEAHKIYQETSTLIALLRTIPRPVAIFPVSASMGEGGMKYILPYIRLFLDEKLATDRKTLRAHSALKQSDLKRFESTIKNTKPGEDQGERTLRDAVTALQSALRPVFLRRTFESTWFGSAILDLPDIRIQVIECDDERQLKRVERQNNKIREVLNTAKSGSSADTRKALMGADHTTRLSISFPNIWDFLGRMRAEKLQLTQSNSKNDFDFWEKHIESIVHDNWKLKQIIDQVESHIITKDDIGRHNKVIVGSEFPRAALLLYLALDRRPKLKGKILMYDTLFHKEPHLEVSKYFDPKYLCENEEDILVLVGTLGKISEGLNLQRASLTLPLEPTANVARIQQLTGRTRRPRSTNMKRGVASRTLVLGTAEQAVYQSSLRRKEVTKAIMTKQEEERELKRPKRDENKHYYVPETMFESDGAY